MRARILVLVFLSLGSLSSASQCEHVIENGVSPDNARLIVDKHNELRKMIATGELKHQPRGINLKTMKYDEKLAAEAQRIADSCIYAHKTVNDGRWHSVGQNLALMSSTALTKQSDWSWAIQAWFDEHKDYKFGACCPSLHNTGHYTQIIWADTEYIGCGYSYYETNSLFRYHKLYVCNYGPGGNYIGLVPYKTGKSGCENLC